MPGSDVVGDFTSAGYGSDLMVTDRIRRDLSQRFPQLRFGEIRMEQNAKLKRPKKPNRRTKKRVWLPYEGPDLYELIAEQRVSIDAEASCARISKDCDTCGKTYWELTDATGKPGLGLQVNESALQGASIFRLLEFPTWLMFTDEAKEFILARAFTNISFLEMGKTS